MNGKPISTQTEPISTEIPLEGTPVAETESSAEPSANAHRPLELPPSVQIGADMTRIEEGEGSVSRIAELEAQSEVRREAVEEMAVLRGAERPELVIPEQELIRGERVEEEELRESTRDPVEMQPEVAVPQQLHDDSTEVLVRGFEVVERLEKAVRRFERRAR